MKMRFWLGLPVLVLASMPMAQEAAPLTIGDKAPAFKPEATVQGPEVKGLKPGRVQVVEFWAIWCGPCRAVFPHLSDLTDKYKSKVDVYSVNTWDRRELPSEKEANDPAHRERVRKFVADNADKMRYTVVLDDHVETIASTWMRAAQRNGIPCAFIVDKTGTIAWIGHPATMDEPLEKITNGTWDLDAEKAKYEESMKGARMEARIRSKAASAAKAMDIGAIDALLAEAAEAGTGPVSTVISACVAADPAFGLKVIKAHAGKIKSCPAEFWCSVAGSVVRNAKADDATKAAAIAVSAECAGMAQGAGVVIAAYTHGMMLKSTGDKGGAITWLSKAKQNLEKIPEAYRAAYAEAIESQLKSLEG